MLAEESRGHFVGPVDPTGFIKHFIIDQDKLDNEVSKVQTMPNIESEWTGLKEKMQESDMYKPIVKGARSFIKKKSGFVDSHSSKDPHRDDLSPDIINYKRWITAPTSKVDLSKAEYFIEVKTGKTFDPFVDNDEKGSDRDPQYPFEAIADSRMITRGQILTYCTAIARSQFRTHVFGVIIVGTRARLFRWNPSAMVVTSLFDYTDKTRNNILGQFIWCYDNASLRTRGHDTSVRSIPEEKAITRFGEDEVEEVRKRNSLHSHFCIMNISDRDQQVDENEEIHCFQHPHLISYPPPYQRTSPFGRMTRTLHALDEETKEFVFVKDYWQVRADGMMKESDVYAILEKHNVPNIAPFGNGNDVLCEVYSQRLKRPVLKPVNSRHERSSFGDKIQEHKELERWRLFRMSLRVIGDGLATFTSSKELVTAIADAMEAHDTAYFDARILHRDISVGNILIHNGKGLLIDWDLCLPMDGKVQGPRRHQRTGTWQFMSAAILDDPTKIQDISDDRESAFHVLTWTALCYGQHDRTRPGKLRRYIRQYDESYSAGEYVQGGQVKRAALIPSLLSEEVFFNPALNALIAELTDHLSARYFAIKPRAQSFLESLKKKIADLEQLPERTESEQETLETHRESRATNPAYPLLTSREFLNTRGWLVETMRGHLDSHDWPLGDKALPDGLHETCNSKKRGRDEDAVVVTDGWPKHKVERREEYLDVSSSRVPYRSDSSGLMPVMEVDDED
ncbi:hypothetical protein M413DRAFT_446141 [Hebeloma cylindrosporum]|uniref:Protein kinase domain-containing protein n=1 Tax=Hebeloma cylindrosporum TaxID=76867 RepID=A0A0C2XSS5_HEBCY|nr:hypothetical protein M413DRAFT_446141 [Hebeloma cylindrosporum h7]